MEDVRIVVLRLARQRLSSAQAALRTASRLQPELRGGSVLATLTEEIWRNHPDGRDRQAEIAELTCRNERALALLPAVIEKEALRLRAITAKISAPYKPVLLALNDEGPRLYEHGMRTGNWAPYREFRTRVDRLLSEIKDLGLTTVMVMKS